MWFISVHLNISRRLPDEGGGNLKDEKSIFERRDKVLSTKVVTSNKKFIYQCIFNETLYASSTNVAILRKLPGRTL